MPFVRVWVHLIWGTKNRESIIAAVLRPKLSGHIRINAKSKDIWLDSINVVSDHAHALISLKGDQTIGKVAQLIKGESSHWVNQEKLTNFHFEWQDEYIAISVSESMVEQVREYIRTQEEHHKKKSFAEEYREFLEKHGGELGAKAPPEK